MKIEFDYKKIEAMLVDFSRSTGLTVSFCDLSYQIIASGLFERGFCPIIKSSKYYDKECVMSDHVHFLDAEQKKSSIKYICHAGLTEIITPLLYENTLFGFTILGQFISEENFQSNETHLHALAKKFDLDYQCLLQEYQKLPVLSSQQITSAINILHSCIQSLMYNQRIRLQNDILPQHLKEYILENLSSPLTVDHLCKKFFLSTKKLYSVFDTTFHMTVKDFILTERIHLAKKLLTSSDNSLTEISEKVGFNDYSYFIRIFKKRTGLSPLKYRKTSEILSNTDPSLSQK